jgi:hypothetical protein
VSEKEVIDEEVDFDDLDKVLNRKERRKLKAELKLHKDEVKELIKRAREKMKEPGFLTRAEGKSAWCMNNRHDRCSGHFTSNKNVRCLCPCHNSGNTQNNH